MNSGILPAAWSGPILSLLRIVTADDASTIALLAAAGMPGSTPHEAVHSPKLLLIDGDANVRGIYDVTESGLDETFQFFGAR